MRQVLFVPTHLCSGSSGLASVLDRHPRVMMTNVLATYSHPFDLEALLAVPHKNSTAAAVWGDQLLFNYQLGHDHFYGRCKFIYVIRQAKASLNEIVSKAPNYSPLTALRYYSFRLRRLYEMATRTPGAVLARRQHLISGAAFPLIEDYLGLDSPLVPQPELFDEPPATGLVPDDLIEEAQDCYEKYYYLMRDMGLKSA